ncbi:MAG: hypothetical protein ACI4PM_07140 [Butyricicoccus sp.]
MELTSFNIGTVLWQLFNLAVLIAAIIVVIYLVKKWDQWWKSHS